MHIPGYTEAAMRSMRARALRQALEYGTGEFSEMTGIPYGSITQWGFPDKGSLTAMSCQRIIAALADRGIPVDMNYLAAGEYSGLKVGLADRIKAILGTGIKLSDKQALDIVCRMPL